MQKRRRKKKWIVYLWPRVRHCLVKPCMRTNCYKTLFCRFACIALLTVATISVNAQQTNFFTPADSLHKGRVALVTGSWSVIYGSALVALSSVWYNQYELSKFHTFNDFPEWNQM